MISTASVEQLQVASYLIRSYGYEIAGSSDPSAGEIWLTSKTHGTYPVIRISSSSLTDDEPVQDRIQAEYENYRKKMKSEDRLLDIHLCPIPSSLLQPGYADVCVIDGNATAGHNADGDFPGILHQIRPVADPAAAYESLRAELYDYAKNVRKPKRIVRQSEHAMPIVSYVVAGICLLVFLLIHTSHFTGNSSETAILYGAYYKPFILAGEWWRLLSAGFVHVATWHLAMNMLSLINLGFALENLYGWRRYLIILLASTIAGNLLVFAVQDNIVMVGLSGGLYGLMAAYLCFVILCGGWDNPVIRASLLRTLGINLLINFVPGVGYMAHLGGFLCGAVLGFLLAPQQLTRNRRTQAAVVGIALCVLLGVGSVRNAKILTSQRYYQTDITILQEEMQHGMKGYALWVAGNLDHVYGVPIKEYLEEE